MGPAGQQAEVKQALRPWEAGGSMAAAGRVVVVGSDLPGTVVVGGGPLDAKGEAALVERRDAAIEKLTLLQDEVLGQATNQAFVQRYSPVFLEQLSAMFAAKNLQEVTMAEMQVRQMEAAWKQVRQNLSLRTRAFVLAGLVFGLFILALVGLAVFGESLGVRSASFVLPVINVPLFIVLWSAVGSLSAVFYRLNSLADIEMEDPLRLLVTRPIIGVIMGTVSYLIVQLGLLTLSEAPAVTAATAAAGDRATYFLSFISFLVGFSDRFGDGLLRSLVGRLGGDKDDELVTVQARSTGAYPVTLMALADAQEVRRQRTSGDAGRPDEGTESANGKHGKHGKHGIVTHPAAGQANGNGEVRTPTGVAAETGPPASRT